MKRGERTTNRLRKPCYRSNRCQTVCAGTTPWDPGRFDDHGRLYVVRACAQQWLNILGVEGKTDNGNGVFGKGYYANLYFYGGTLWSMTHKRYPFGPAFRCGTTFFQQRAFPVPFPLPPCTATLTCGRVSGHACRKTISTPVGGSGFVQGISGGG